MQPNIEKTSGVEVAPTYEKYHESELRKFVDSMGGLEKIENSVVFIQRSNSMRLDSLSSTLEDFCVKNGAQVVYFDRYGQHDLLDRLYTLSDGDRSDHALDDLIGADQTKKNIAIFSDFQYKERESSFLELFRSFLKKVGNDSELSNIKLFSPYSAAIGDKGNAEFLRYLTKEQLFFLREDNSNSNRLCGEQPLIELVDIQEHKYNLPSQNDKENIQYILNCDSIRLKDDLDSAGFEDTFYLICILSLMGHSIEPIASTMITQEMGFSQADKMKIIEMCGDHAQHFSEANLSISIKSHFAQFLSDLVPAASRIKLGTILVKLAEENKFNNVYFPENNLKYKWIGTVLSHPNYDSNTIAQIIKSDLFSANEYTRNVLKKFLPYLRKVTGNKGFEQAYDSDTND